MALSISSPLFRDGETIPRKYTCEGQDISPALSWGEPPAGTRAFSLILDDPDAPMGVFTHWVVYNIPASERGLTEAVPTEGKLAGGALQGKNDSRKLGYIGPCPPPGGPHRYYFTLYALSEPLKLAPGASKKEVLAVIEGKVLSQAKLMGRYQR